MAPFASRPRLILAFVSMLWLSPIVAGQGSRNDLAKQLPRIEANAAVVKGPENVRLRVLIAVDTDDQGGVTWGRDGLNVKSILEAMLAKQHLAERATIDMMTGKQVTPDKILAYYKNLKFDANEALLFYYSGHGGFHLKKGHFLALTHGKLYRADLIAAMTASQPRLCVLLTDCCSNYAGGALPGEPKGSAEIASLRKDFGHLPRARQEEPKVSHMVTRVPNPNRIIGPARPVLPAGTFTKAKELEPVGVSFPVKFAQPRNLGVAKREEPPAAAIKASSGWLPTLTTHQGKVPLQEVLNIGDGDILRDLFFRHAGMVDINGCTKGDLSYGMIGWGGSLFTNSLIVLQKSKSSDFDKNGNRVVEWSEFFPALQRSTTEASSRIAREPLRQIPEATRLGAPILP